MNLKEKLYSDFSSGVFTGADDEQIPDNGLKATKNIYWDGTGFRMRFSVVTDRVISGGSISHIYAMAYVTASDGYLYAIIAGQSASTKRFIYQKFDSTWGTPTTIAAYSAVSWDVAATNPHMMLFGDKVVVIDPTGTYKPLVIYFDGSAWQCVTINTYATETLSYDTWWAGQYTSDSSMTDDSSDAQDATSAFAFSPDTTNGHGFYVTAVTKFSKLAFTLSTAFVGASLAATYQYHNGTGWQTLTLATTPTWTTTGAKVLEFNLPDDWDVIPNTATDPGAGIATGSFFGRYAIRVTFTDYTTAGIATVALAVSQTRPLDHVMANEIPTFGCVHRNRLYLASGNAVNYSMYDRLTGWKVYNVEYFDEGGTVVKNMISHGDDLMVFKDSALYRLSGTTSDNIYNKKVDDHGSPAGRYGAISYDGLLYFIDGQSNVRVFAGAATEVISHRISRATFAPASALFFAWGDQVYVDLGSDIYMFSPNTLSRDEEGRLTPAWYPLQMHIELGSVTSYVEGSEEEDEVLFLAPGTYLRTFSLTQAQATEAVSLAAASDVTGIVFQFWTKGYDFGKPSVKKVFPRVKVVTEDSVNALAYVIPDGNTSRQVSKAVANSGENVWDISLPYSIDGYRLAIKVDGNSDAAGDFMNVRSVAVQYGERRF